MKNLFTLGFLIGLTGLFAQQQPVKVDDGYKIEIKTSAICEMCKETIEQDLTFEKGVKSVDLDLDTKIVTVVFNDRKTNPETIRLRISKIGYHADDVKRDSTSYKKLPFCCKDEGHSVEK